MAEVRIKFVSKKISKVKWKPQSNNIFVTGSWDDESNHLCVWNYPSAASITRDSMELDNTDPYVIAEIDFPGSVTDLKVLLNDIIFASSSNGSLFMYKLIDQKIVPHYTWEDAHRFNSCRTAPITSISIKGNEVTTVGEDGKICIFNYNKLINVREIKSTDQCAFSVVSYLRHQELVAGNVLGYLKVFDLRMGSDQPTHTLIMDGEQIGVSCLTVHPTQPHVFATGHDNGTLCVWDLRHDSRPTTMLTGHVSSIMDVLFHPLNPDVLYTSSMDGMVWQWNASSVKPDNGDNEQQLPITGNPWLNCNTSKHKLDITSLFANNTVSVNSLDIVNSTLLWGADNEALYILSDVIV